MSFYRTHTLTCTPSLHANLHTKFTYTLWGCFTRIISNILSLILVFFLMPACRTHDVASFFGRRTNAFSSWRHMPLGAHTSLLLRATYAPRRTYASSSPSDIGPSVHIRLFYSGRHTPLDAHTPLLRATYALGAQTLFP
jgi:hypothetical protein